MSPEQENTQRVGDIYIEHHQWLKGWIRKKLGCNELAADLTQDTFVRLLKKSNASWNGRGPKGLLATIARGLFIDHWRRKQIEQAWLESLANLEADFQPSAEHCAEMIEVLCQLDAVISKMPMKVANTLLLSQLHGLTYREIADHLSVSERMVKRYMAQAMLQCVMLQSELSL